MNSRRITNLCALVLVAGAAALFGCLDADPLDTGEDDASLHVELLYLTEKGAAKDVEIGSIRIALFDVTDDPWTDKPELFDLAAEERAPARINDATGMHALARLRVELSDRRVYRVVAFISLLGEGVIYTGQKTVELAPNDRTSVTLVMTPAGDVDPDTFDLVAARTVGQRGDTLDIPLVLINPDTLGGIQFRLQFERDILDAVIGISVDPASRLVVDGGGGDPREIFGHFASTDSSARVVVVDLPAGGEGELSGPLRTIPPGDDLLFSLVVRLEENLTGLPDTMDLLLDDVFFSTPSGSSDIAVPDPTSGILIIME